MHLSMNKTNQRNVRGIGEGRYYRAPGNQCMMEVKRKSVSSQECLHRKRRTILPCTGKPVHDLVEVKRKSIASQACFLSEKDDTIVHRETSPDVDGIGEGQYYRAPGNQCTMMVEVKRKRVVFQACLHRRRTIISHTEKSAHEVGGSEGNQGKEFRVTRAPFRHIALEKQGDDLRLRDSSLHRKKRTMLSCTVKPVHVGGSEEKEC